MKSPLLALIGLAMLTVACSQTDPGITTSVKSRLIADDLVKARHIDVDTKDHMVTLTGEVNSAEERERAVQITRDTKGVRNVTDQLTVIPEAAATTGILPNTPLVATDAGITAEVKSKLLANPNTPGLAVNVDTRDGVVTLAGSVKSPSEKAAAIRLARDVAGVTSVVDHLTIESRR